MPAKTRNPSVNSSASMKFLIYEDNVGGYHWTIVAGNGETLVRSGSFGSHEEAEQAADIVHRGASQAAFEDRTAHPSPVRLPVRRRAAAAR